MFLADKLIRNLGEGLTVRSQQAGGQTARLCLQRLSPQLETCSLSRCDQGGQRWPQQPGTGHTAGRAEARRAADKRWKEIKPGIGVTVETGVTINLKPY